MIDETVDLLGIGCSEQLGLVKQGDLAGRYAELLETATGDRRLARRATLLFSRAGVSTRRVALSKDGVWDPFRLYAGADLPSTAERMEVYRSIAPELAVEAARAALQNAGVDPHEVGSLVVATCTGLGDPDFDVELISRLGFAEDVERSQLVWMSCSGAFPAIRVARRSSRIHRRPSVVICVELCSLHVRADDDLGSALAHALFADGAAALVVGPPSTAPSLARLGRGATRLVISERESLTWRFTDHGFRANLSRELPEQIGRACSLFLPEALCLAPGDVDAWAVHPGGPAILDALENSLGLSSEVLACSRDVLRTHGNMSSPTVLYVLREQLKKMQRADRGLMLGFGTGLTLEGVPFVRGARAYEA